MKVSSFSHGTILINPQLEANPFVSSPVNQYDLFSIRPKKSYAYYHMIYKGRLRIGKEENAWWQGICFLLSFGIFGWFWFTRILAEIRFHLEPSILAVSFTRTWLVLLPGFHMLMFYRLAKLLMQMEIENNYCNTSPALAFLLSIFPPFAIVYLQHATNHHWRAHVQHEILKEAAQETGR